MSATSRVRVRAAEGELWEASGEAPRTRSPSTAAESNRFENEMGWIRTGPPRAGGFVARRARITGSYEAPGARVRGYDAGRGISGEKALINTRLANRYELLGELGRGGMGVVERARGQNLNRDVAVTPNPSLDLTPELAERFQREAQVVAQMDHPAIVTIHDVGSDQGSLFFVMPLVGGTNLLRLIRDQSLRLGEVVNIGIQVAEALDYSHSRGVVHRDIK